VGAGSRENALDHFPMRWNQIGAPDSCFYAFSSREPASASLENALDSCFYAFS
jgi:hypothetical protein